MNFKVCHSVCHLGSTTTSSPVWSMSPNHEVIPSNRTSSRTCTQSLKLPPQSPEQMNQLQQILTVNQWWHRFFTELTTKAETVQVWARCENLTIFIKLPTQKLRGEETDNARPGNVFGCYPRCQFSDKSSCFCTWCRDIVRVLIYLLDTCEGCRLVLRISWQVVAGLHSCIFLREWVALNHMATAEEWHPQAARTRTTVPCAPEMPGDITNILWLQIVRH